MSDTLMSAQQRHFGQTPSQTVGPYFAYGLTATQYGYEFGQLFDGTVALAHAAGTHIRIEGMVYDGDGVPVADALIEVLQADAAGRYRQSDSLGTGAPPDAAGFRGFGRVGTGADAEARFVFHTIKPGAAAPGEAPHVHVAVFMRGILAHAFTRIYFADEPQANASDAVLQSVPAERRHTLLAARCDEGGVVVYRFDIHMQGPHETVFFDV